MTPRTAIAADAAHDAPSRLPTPRQLAQLGVVLCLYRQQPGGELAGWSQAVRAEATLGEICGVLKEAWGVYREPARF